MPQLTEEQKVKLDSNIKNMLANGATNEQVVSYANDFKNKFSTVLKPTGETSNGIPTVTIQQKSTPTQAPAWQDTFEGVVGIKEAKKQELPQIPFETTSTPDPYSSYTLTTRGRQLFGEGAKQTKKEIITQSQDKGDPYLAVYKNQIRKIGIDPDQEYTPSPFIQLKKQENLSNINQLKSDIESGSNISGKQNPTQEDEMTAISERLSEELSPIKQEKLNLFNKITENNNFIKSLQAQKTPSEEVITEEEIKSIDETINKVKKENEILSKKYQDLDTDSKLITSYFEKPTLKRGITYQTFKNNPEELLKLDETKVLYGALEDYLNSSNINDNTLRKAKLLNATTLRDGTKLFDALTKPIWTKNEYEEIYSLLNIKPEELQKEASQSIDAVTNLMKEDIYKQGKQLSVYKNLPKNYLNDKIQSGEITEEEAKQFIQEYTSQVDNFNKKIASLNRVEEIQNKYFKDLKRFQAFKEYQDEISKKFNFNQDIVGALREGTVDNVIDAIDFANKEKATIEGKLGVITPEQELAKYLQIGTSKDYDYMRYTPDYIKNMQFLEVNPETEEKSINWRALGHSAIKTTAESYMLYLTGLGLSKAVQLQRLSKYGKVGEFVSEHAGIIPASELYIQPDMFNEALQKYENGEISLSQLRSLSEMQAGIEGVTELWFLPEAKALKGVLNTGSKELALNVFLKSATGKELVNTFGKAATKAAWEGTKTGLGESWEEVLGNTFNDIYNYQVKLDNPDYKYTTQNTLENNLNTVVNTFISMYPTILLGAGQTYASNKSSAATQASLYEVAQNPSEFYKYAKDFIENTNNLEWYFPTLTKKEVLNKVAETNNKLADLYKQALPITSKLDNESDKIDYFNSLNIVNTLTPTLRTKKEDELLEESVQKIQKYTENVVYQDSLKAKDPLKFLAYKVENGLENYEYDSKDPIKLSIIGKSLSNSLQEFQNKPGYEKLVKKIEEKIDLVNKNIETANKIEVSQEQQPLISEPVQKESIDLLQQETEKLNKLSKEEVESYKVPKEITDKEERKQLTLQRLQKLQEFENKENEVLGFQRNQKVQLLSDKNTDKYYTIQGEENGRLLLKADFDGVTETTKVSPEDIIPFTPKALKEETVVETTPTKQETKEIKDIEAKKADIERRRQEELAPVTKEIEKVEKEIGDLEKEDKTQGSYNFSATSNSGKWNSANNELESLVQNHRKAFSIYKLLIGDVQSFKELVDVINEKTDANIEYTNSMKRADETMSAEEIQSAINSYNESSNTKKESAAQIQKDVLKENNLEDEKEYSVEEIVDKFPLKGVQKVIYDIIKDVVKRLGIKVKFSSSRVTEGFNGSFNPLTGEILIHPAAITTNNIGETLVHEVVHAVTTKIINRVNSGVTTGLTQKQINAVKGLQKLFEAVKADNNLESKYPVKDVFEFIAHLTNDTFAKELESKDKTFLQKVVDFIADILGITNANELTKQYLKDIISDGAFLQEQGITVLASDYSGNLQGSKENSKLQELKDKLKELKQQVSKINAKYDAELEALEKPLEEEEAIEQVPVSSAIAAFGEPIKTNPEDIIADLEEQIKQQEEKQDKENTKTTEVKLEQKYGRFHPWATVPYSLDKPTDIVINTAINTYNYLFNLSKESGKPFSELGYYTTIFDVRDFDSSLFPKETQDYWTKNEKRGQVAVITDEKGKILKFSEVGKPDNENGLWAMQWFNASLEMPKFEGNNKELQEEKWLSDKAKLDALRANVSINKPITLTIQDVVVSSQYTASEEKPISLQFTEIPFINIGRPTTITTNDGITHNIQSGKTKIGEELANSIYDFLNVNNTQEGLPEAFYPKSDSYEDKLTAFHNRLSFSVAQKNKDKTFPEIIFYTQHGIRMFRLESDGTPSLYIRGKTYLTKEEIVKYISENEMNISYYLNSLKDQSKPILTIYSLKDNKFEAKETPYQRFIADNFKIAISTNQKPKFNPYLTFGESVQRFKKSQETPKKEEKVEQKPDLQQPQKQEEKKLPTKKVREKKGNTLDDTLLRHILLPSRGTKSQQSTAKEWFDNYIALTGANYQDLRDIYNSTARATWTKAAITLYKTGVYTDLYHEAFHDFTQLYLTPEQKISLYKEALSTKEGKQAIEKEKKRLNKETLSPLEEYHAIEELLAEDFLNYMLSEQKLILNQRPKRNTIFRKIYNFLKSLFGVNPSIQEVYERLASNKPIKAKRDSANALFGKLNSSYDQLSIRDSIALTKALDGLLAQRVINGNYSISKIFLEKGFIDKVYNSVYNDLLDSYSDLEVDYESADENRQAEIQYTLNNLDYLLDNWNEIIKKHKDNSEYLKVSKDFLPENLDEDGNEIENNTEKFDDAKENINPMDDVAQHIKFLIASLPKHEWKGGKKIPVSNSFLPIVRETVNFGDAKNLLAEKLQGVKDYDSIFNRVKELSQKHPEFEQLLKALPLPEKSLDFYELQLKNSFVNAFSKPFRYLKTTNFEYSSQGTKVISRNAQFTTVKKLKDDWTLSIQEVDNPYRITEESGQKSIDIPKILEDFKTITKNNSEDFLQAIGFVFSTPTKNSQDYLDIINLKDNTLREILNSLKSYNLLQQGKYPKDVIPTTDVVNKLQSPVYSLTNILDRNLKSNQYTLFSAPRPALDKLINLELTNSEKYHTDNVSNAENNNQWIPKNWSLQSLDAAILNNVDKYPTYSSLIASKEGSYWNIDLNPDANNLILHSLFDLDPNSLTYQQRRTKSNGSPVTLELFDQNGVIITNEASALRDGTKTSKLTRFMALVADFPVFLSTGEKQHPRYGDKSTSIGSLMEYPSFVKGNVKTNKHLPVDIKDFNTDKISGQAWFIFRNQLISALQITNDFYSDTAYQHTLHITKNIQNSPFGLFDLILTKETQQALASITSEEPINVSDLVDKNKELILKDLSEFFNSQTKLTLNEFSFNEISPNDFLPQYLLDNYSFEQLVRAFTVNTWIYNAEHIRNEFQDLRFYKQDKRYAEPFKRFSKSTSTGLLSVNDEQNNEFFNNPSTGSFAEKKWYDENHTEKSLPYVETGVANTIIIEDVKFTPTNYANQLLERIKKAPQDEIDAVKAKLKDLELTDAMAFCTFDFYRNLTLFQAKEEWNGEKEALYQKLARRETLTPEEETSAYLFFPPLKQRVAGRTFDESTKKYIPIDYKFAITPLVPTTIKGKNFEAIRDNMIRQNAGLALFGTAAKHSAILNSNNEFNKFYESPGVPYTGDYTINPVPIESFFEVVKQPSKYKEEVRFSTQLRTLLFVNLFENGVPLDYSKANNKTKEDWDKLTEQEKLASSPSYKRAKDFSDAIDNIVKIRKESLLRRLKATYNPTTDSYTIDEEQLSKILEEEFNKRGLPLNVINSIQLKDGKFKYPFDATIARNSIEDVLLSLIDNELRKQDVHGEALIQVANSGFENLQTDETLPFYEAGKNNGKTSAQKVKIALQGNFELLLQHPDVLTLSSKDKITPLQALNTLIKDENWLNKSNHRELISLGSVRIPVQGLNSMEFLEVYEFLPKEAGSIVVVSPALVAKSGSDFDWDKLTTLFPNIFYNSFTKELKLYNVKDIKLTNEEALKELKKQKSYPKEKINSLYKIRNELKEELETYKQERDLAKESKIDFLRHLRFLDIEIALFRQQLDLLEEAEFAFKNEDDLKVISDLVESTIGETGVLQGIESAIEATKNKIKERVNQANIEREFLVKSLNESISSSRENIAYSRKEIENIDKTINSVKSYLSDIQELIYKASAEKAYQNSLIKIMREVLEDPNNFVNLMLPNDTYMFEPNADKRRAAKNEGKKAGYSLVPSVVENLNQHEANFVGKDALGIAALYNKMLPQLQKVGMYLNNTYISNTIFGTTRNTTNRFKHNEIDVNGTPHISISGVYSVPNLNGDKFKISEAISQIMNGTVDVAKKPWIFDLNIKKEFIATQLYHLLQGTHKDDVMAFFNQPSLDIYLRNLQNYKNPLLKALNPSKSKQAKAYAILSVLEEYGNELSNIRIDLGTIKKPNVKSIPEIIEILKEHLDDNKPQQFYGVVNKFRDLADAHPSMFNQKHYNFYKFAFPEENGKIAKPTTEEDKLAQVLYLIQYLELDEQNSKFQNVMKTTNQDTKKMGSVQLSLKRLTDLYQTQFTDLLPSHLVDKMTNEGYTKAFTHEESGIDSFISQVSKQLFELTNHKIINKFILDEFRRPFEDVVRKDHPTIRGNYIAFEDRTDDDFDSFTETIKNDFILYIYDNIVYEDANPVIAKVRKQMTYDSALATELEQIKINFPTLVKNNLFLSSLVRDNGNIKKGYTKPTRVNIKSLISKPTQDVSNILTEDFNTLLEFSDETYPIEKQQIIQNFAKKLAKFAFVQSGLNNSPISFAKLIPQESYGEDITEAIKAMKSLFDSKPEEAEKLFTRFYLTYFRPNNPKFFQNITKEDPDTGETYKVIPVKEETFRLKDYQDSEFPDILKKKENILSEKIKANSSIKTFERGEAFSNPTILYVYEQNYENKYAKGSANILIDKTSIKKAENTVSIYLYPTVDKTYSDKDLPTVSKNIDNAINEIVQKFKTGNYKEIAFPENLTEISKLEQSSPQSFSLLANTLKEQFGISIKNAKFEEPKVLETVESEEIIVSSQDMKNPKNYTNYSGAAEGGDKEWEKIGKEFGIGKQVNFVPNDIKRLTPEQLTEVENAYQKAVKDLGRRPLDANTYAGGLVRRDYLQAKAGDAIFAISTILEPDQTDKKGYKNKSGKKVVEGGTGYAVQMGINLGKIVYVFDQIKNKWFTWALNIEGTPDFVETNTPILTEKFTGIGTRELNHLGKKAIKDVYQKTFNQQDEDTNTKKGCDNPF